MILEIFEMGSMQRALQCGSWRCFHVLTFVREAQAVYEVFWKCPIDGMVAVLQIFRFDRFVVSVLLGSMSGFELLSSVWCCSLVQFFFLVPFVINYHVVRSTKISFNSQLRQ